MHFSCVLFLYSIYHAIVGRTWVGDLGFWVDNSPVESGITFKSNGFGVDEQWYYDWDRVAAVLDVRWWIEDGDLFLDYGNGYPLLILADVYVEGRYLTGRLYSNNIDQGTVTLEMSN